MNIVNSGFKLIDVVNEKEILQKIERIGRVCYKSEDAITEDSAEKFVKMIIKRGHEAMIEHVSLSVLFTTDRGVTHEMVRHRLASFAQESTRYCNYSKDKFENGITIINPLPSFWNSNSEADKRKIQIDSALQRQSESAYLELLSLGASPQEARRVLTNALKSEIVITANLREWRCIFTLRTESVAHPQMREVMIPLLLFLKSELPTIFNDIVLK